MAVNTQAIRAKSKDELVRSLVSVRERAAKLRKESKAYTERGMVALAGFGGAVVAGAAKAYDMTEIGGVPVVAVAGGLAELVGIVGGGGSDVGDFALIAFGASLAAPEIADQVAGMLR